MMRGESAHQCTGQTLAEMSDDRKIEMTDKKQEENVCGTKEGLSELIVAWVAYICVGRSYQDRGETLLG